jgi:hypothetical protein
VDLDTGASAYSGEVGKELANPYYIEDEEYQVQTYMRVASPYIAAMFQRPECGPADIVGNSNGKTSIVYYRTLSFFALR